MGTVVRPVRFNDVEVAAVEGVRGDLTFNAWVRRACVRQAELERALTFEDPGADPREPDVPLSPEVRKRLADEHGIVMPSWQPSFKPDFGKRLKG